MGLHLSEAWNGLLTCHMGLEEFLDGYALASRGLDVSFILEFQTGRLLEMNQRPNTVPPPNCATYSLASSGEYPPALKN